MIELVHVSKQFGNFQAVSDLSFSLKPGEVVGLLGPNGAGKTTTMRLLTGFMPPTRGSIHVDGFDLIDQPRDAKKRMGYLPENPPLYPELTVEQNLSFAAEIHGVSAKDKKKKIERALQMTHLLEERHRPVANLSKGYRQRIGIAQAIVHEPSFLVLDEPTIGLDPKQVLEIRELIHSLKGEVGILISSHIMQEIQAVCDRVLMIHRGKLVADGKIADLTQSLKSKQYLVTVKKEDHNEAEQQLMSHLKKIEGVLEVIEIREHSSDLEQLFLKLTQDL